VSEKFFQQRDVMDVRGVIHHSDGFVVWLRVPEQLQIFPIHRNNLRSSMQLTLEIESDSVIPFFEVLEIRKETKLAIRIYRKPTQTG
jgi:hypothetical protein